MARQRRNPRSVGKPQAARSKQTFKQKTQSQKDTNKQSVGTHTNSRKQQSTHNGKQQNTQKASTSKPTAKKPTAIKTYALKTVTLLNDSVNFLKPQTPLKERIAMGKAMREKCPRTSHGDWKPLKNRTSPLELLASQDATRLHKYLPLRYGRMMESPFAFYRGAALIMASDLSTVPRTELIAQLCGDCHLSNFGVFSTPERNAIFDMNDMDETLPGPIEWDLKRLAASFIIAANDNKLSKSVAQRCVEALAKSYRETMEEFANSTALDVWYSRVDFEELLKRFHKPGKTTVLEKLAKTSRRKTHAGAVAKLTEVKEGKRRIKDDPPLIFHFMTDIQTELIQRIYQVYARSLWQSRRRLLQRYHFVDFAAKIVGVGSVGTQAMILLLKGDGGEDDYIILQFKEACCSVLERYLGKSEFSHPGERIVNGQRVLQAASDLFLGWTTGELRGKPYYVRQLMDGKASVPIDQLDADGLESYAKLCAITLARGHARTGDPAVIHGYLGTKDAFDEALVKFSTAYAKQNEQDYETLIDAIKNGQIVATPGI